MPGGSVNLTCVAVGAPMPYVKWMLGAEELTKEDEMPVGRNVLELSNVLRSANYTCVAISSLGMIEATAQVTVKGGCPGPRILRGSALLSVLLAGAGFLEGRPEIQKYRAAMLYMSCPIFHRRPRG